MALYFYLMNGKSKFRMLEKSFCTRTAKHKISLSMFWIIAIGTICEKREIESLLAMMIIAMAHGYYVR